MSRSLVARSLVAGLLAISLVNVAEAQRGGGRGGRGGGGPFGGGRGGGGIISLVGNEAVQKELGINDDAKGTLAKLSEDFRDETRKAMEASGGFEGLRDLSREDRQKAMDKMSEQRKEITAKMLPDLKKALTEDQFNRLQQINIQAMRDLAYSDADVVKQLGLEKDQQDKIGEIVREYGDKQRELFRDGAGDDREAARAKMDELNKEKEAKLNEILTADQQAKLKSLKGKDFDVAQLNQRGFGGPGGGGPGGGRPPRGESARPKAKAKAN